jgi:hypothetical protein
MVKNMKNLQIKKLKKVKASKGDENLFYQLVEFTINFYGNKMTSILDTKITKEGKQIVIDGNGFIEAGLIINK